VGPRRRGQVDLTLALKFAAGQAERGGGWLVCRLSASTMEQDHEGLLDAMLGKSAGRATSCAAEKVCGQVHELLQSPAWSRAWLAVLFRLPAPADDELAKDPGVGGRGGGGLGAAQDGASRHDGDPA